MSSRAVREFFSDSLGLIAFLLTSSLLAGQVLACTVIEYSEPCTDVSFAGCTCARYGSSVRCWDMAPVGLCNNNTQTQFHYTVSEGVDCTCGGGTCFLPGTQVSTPQGEKSIETLKPGDEVFSFDELTGKKLLNVVQNSPVRTVPQYYIIKTESGREVKVTAEHPFLTKSKEDQSESGVLGGLERLGELVRFIKSKVSGIIEVSR